MTQIKGWSPHRDTQVVIRPVRDLSDYILLDAYEVPGRLREQVDERDGTGIHPWCTPTRH